MEPVWVVAIGGICAALGALVSKVLEAFGKWMDKRGAAKRKEATDEYDRQKERQEALDEDTREFIDRQAKIIDELKEEMSRRWVAEMALMAEVTERRAGESYIWAVSQAFHNQLVGLHQSPCMDLPPRPVFPPPAKEREEHEFELRRRQHNTDLIQTEALENRKKRPDSDVKGGQSSPANGGAK